MMKFDKQLIPILSLTFINILGYTILIPVLPFIVEQYGGGPVTYGALLATYSLFQFLGAPVLGSLSDRLSFSTIKALLTKSVDKSQQGEITGLDESILALVAATAPFIAGVFYSQISYYTFPLFAFVIVLPHLFSWLMSRNSLNTDRQRGF